MTTWVALLRGINVGGQKKLPMASLVEVCMGLWPESTPRTYIASGNLIFDATGDSTTLATELGAVMNAKFGFEVLVSVTEAGAFQKLVKTCPYAGTNGKGVHGFFCFTVPSPNWDHINKLKVGGEAIEFYHNIVWLHTPQGIGKSKLANALTATMGHAPMTARNMNTLKKLSEMLDG